MTDAVEVHAGALVIDGHADTPQRFVDEGWEFTGALDGGMLSLEAARAGGLGAEFFAIWAEPGQWKERYAHRTLALIDGVLEQVRRHPAELALCCSAEEIVAAHAAKKFAVLMGIEGGHSIENDLGLLRDYYRLGVRYMTLTWANTNEWADSSGDLDDETVVHHGGLTAFGREVVLEMNRLGMMVDVSHVSDACFWQVLEVSRVPVIASHSSARALASAERNMTDEMLRAVAANGGVVMVNFYPAFLDDAWREAWIALRPERDRARATLTAKYGKDVPYTVLSRVEKELAARLPRVPFATLIDHIDHVAKVAGIAHVGIGTDFDGIQALPGGIDSAADLWKVTAALMERGYSAEEMRMLLGGNLLRVFGAVAAGAGC
ncbi:dipeptidase [Granulicella arctica]|uniref:Membrane dipeptidase n=1 Tax=Granulicella arctica TaxID=940613 RepID=A0A7Y9PL20_9BACT|nr:dipeptidase [Granulicella arctica]NYF81066.1 membrane dipeptidase [Granulicella arctica]